MNVGLPGTGIGGLFYLMTALFMPVAELALTLRGRSSVSRWQVVLHQVILALGVLGGLWATAWLLKHTLPHQALLSLKSTNDRTTSRLGVTPTTLTFVTLGGVLIAVEAGHLLRCAKTRLVTLLHPSKLFPHPRVSDEDRHRTR